MKSSGLKDMNCKLFHLSHSMCVSRYQGIAVTILAQEVHEAVDNIEVCSEHGIEDKKDVTTSTLLP